VLGVIVPDVERSDCEDDEKKPVADFHITPPLTRPSGPVQCRDAKIQLSNAIMPITVKVIANAKTSG
jgi:hypothetical protein